MSNISHELVTIKESYYLIMPYVIAGNIGVYTGQNEIILVDDQWSILSFRLKEILKMVSDRPVIIL